MATHKKTKDFFAVLKAQLEHGLEARLYDKVVRFDGNSTDALNTAFGNQGASTHKVVAFGFGDDAGEPSGSGIPIRKTVPVDFVFARKRGADSLDLVYDDLDDFSDAMAFTVFDVTTSGAVLSAFTDVSHVAQYNFARRLVHPTAPGEIFLRQVRMTFTIRRN